MLGKTLSHYRIVEKIGEGGMGEVYRARDEHLNRDVAIKILPEGTLADEAARKRFRKEALALAKLSHSNIAVVYDFDAQAGVDFLAMEHIGGATLSEKLAAGPLPEKELARLGAQIAEALQEAHEQKVVHRDLKPGNIKLTPKGQVKILDFGLAKLLKPVSEATLESLTETQPVAGTLPYMSPEQLRGEEVDARSDLYSFGVVLYEMATGRRPFEEKLATVLTDAILHQPPPPPRTVNRRLSPILDNIILKALEKEPENRYQSAKELLVDLRRLATGEITSSARRRSDKGRRRARPRRIRTLAVLPLENLSGHPGQEYFADGMTDALITDLAKIGTLKVISRTSAMRYKGTDRPLPEIAQELGVDAVVEGTVLRAGDRVRITAQLIEAVTDRHLWAESYERNLRDVLALQSDVARAIANEIKIAIAPRAEAHLARVRPVNPEAYEAYLKGRYFWNKRTADGLRKGLQYFEQALEKDSSCGLAYAGVADSYSMLAAYSYLPPHAAYPKAKENATKALEIDATLAEACTALAWTRWTYDWAWSDAEREFNRAIELNPSYATAHQWYGEFLSEMGRHEEALAETRKAQELDPFSLSIKAVVGRLLYQAGRYDQAIDHARKTLELDPDFAPAVTNLLRAHTQEGRHEEAIALRQKWPRLFDKDWHLLAHLGYTYAVAGERKEALRVLHELSEILDAFHRALIYAGLGEKDQMFVWLEKAYDERYRGVIELKIYPEFQAQRDEPRFQSLLRRLNFPE